MTQQRIAKACGLSTMTVSRALRGDPRVRHETVMRIRAEAKRLGYRPEQNLFARRMALRRYGRSAVNRAVAVFFPPVFFERASAPYFMPMYNGIMQVMCAQRFSVITHYTSFPPAGGRQQYEPILELPDIFTQGGVDGAILLGHAAQQATITAMLRNEPGFGSGPIISLIEAVPGTCAVLTDDEHSAWQVADHLLGLGHRRILHFCEETPCDGVRSRRLRGYRAACIARGVDPAQCLLFLSWPFHDADGVRRILRAALKTKPSPTAIIGLFDPMAIEVVAALRDLDRRVPQDISVVGHDDTVPLPGPDGHNTLTTVRMPLQDIGVRAAEIAIGQILGSTRHLSQVLLPNTLMLRSTTAPPHAIGQQGTR